MPPLSKAQVRALSTRLRKSDLPDPGDLAMLGEVLSECNAALGEVSAGLGEIGLNATTRLKTSGTIVEKLKRQPGLDLLNIRDLAGARIVQRMTLDEQDELVGRIMTRWPGARCIDRRGENHSHGYRAVHVVPQVLGHPVEIQVRTIYQDTWAQVMEAFGDMWGRGIRYGEPPTDPEDTAFSGASLTRAEWVKSWIGGSEVLHYVAGLENRLSRIKANPLLASQAAVADEVAALETTIEERYRAFLDSTRELAQWLSQR